MRRGIVVAEGRRGLVVLTPDGEFVEVSGRTGAVGEEIGFERPVRRAAAHRRLLLTASAAAVLLLVAVGLARMPVFQGPRVAAYVAIDINPSVEIGVDRKRAVVELLALNPEGEQVIDGVAYRKRPVGDVAAEIIRNAEAAEYLRHGGEVFVTSMAAAGIDGRFEEELVQEIDQAVHAAALRSGGETGLRGTGASAGPSGTTGTSEDAGADGSGEQPGGPAADPAADGPAASSGQSGRDIAVTIVRAPGELRETAKANGVSPGKMAVYLLAEKQGLPISLDDLKRGSIRQAVEPYGGISGLLGDGRSDEERKQELAELLAKEAAKAKANGAAGAGKRNSAGGGKQAADSGFTKATADAGKKAAKGAGRHGKPPSRADGKPGRARPSAETAEWSRQTFGRYAWLAAGRAQQEDGRKRQERQSARLDPRDRVPEKRQEEKSRQAQQQRQWLMVRQERDNRPDRTWQDWNRREQNDRQDRKDRQEPTAGREWMGRTDRKNREEQKDERNREAGRNRTDGQDRTDRPIRTHWLDQQDRQYGWLNRQDHEAGYGGQDRNSRQTKTNGRTQQIRRQQNGREEAKNRQETRQSDRDQADRHGQNRQQKQEQHQQKQEQKQQEQQKQQDQQIRQKRQNQQQKQQQKEQNHQKRQEQKRQDENRRERSGNDSRDDGDRSFGQNVRGRQDGVGKDADRQRDERRTGQDFRLAGFSRMSADAGASSGNAGPKLLPN
jgi:hypothetical protein